MQVSTPRIATHLVFAISASRHMVDLLVLAADDDEDLQSRRSKGRSASDWPRYAPCFALAAGRTRAQTNDFSRPPFRQIRYSSALVSPRHED